MQSKNKKQKKKMQADESSKFKDKNSDVEDMKRVLADPRFAHIATDPVFRYAPKDHRKIKLDSRFSSVFTDPKFHQKHTMDPRGRRENFSTKENLRKFYHMSSDEDDSSSGDSSSGEEDPEEGDESEDSNAEDAEEEPSVGAKETSDDDEPSNDEPLPSTSKSSEEGGNEREAMMLNSEKDFARGVDLFTDDSSSGDSSTTDDDDVDVGFDKFDWGELDADADWGSDDRQVEETRRIAICNMDWDTMRAVDVLHALNSAAPIGGRVELVRIFQSEFGKERMAKEEQIGPSELLKEADRRQNLEDRRMGNLSMGKVTYEDDRSTRKRHNEAVRHYQRNRLRYFYAVAECDSVDTARHIYEQCDRTEYEAHTGARFDLRYILDDVEFDDAPHDSCTSVPKNYAPRLLSTSAVHDSKVHLTWDAADHTRKIALDSVLEKGANNLDEANLRLLVGSSSDEDDSDIEENQADDESSDLEEESSEELDVEAAASSSKKRNNRKQKKKSMEKFRALIAQVHEKEMKEKETREMFHMEDTIELKLEKNNNNKSKDEKVEKEDLTPFEAYLKKRKEKSKARKQERLKEAQKDNAGSSSDSESEGRDDAGSDDEATANSALDATNSYAVCDSDDAMNREDLGDFMTEEFGESVVSEGKKKKKSSKKEKKAEDSDDKEKKKAELELLLMGEEDEDKRHFSMLQIAEDANSSKKKKKRKAKKNNKRGEDEVKAQPDNFRIDLADNRFSALMNSGDYNVDPSHPQYKNTPAMKALIDEVQKKRTANSFEELPEEPARKKNRSTDAGQLAMLVGKVKRKAEKNKNKSQH